jgi:hypothetical protein
VEKNKATGNNNEEQGLTEVFDDEEAVSEGERTMQCKDKNKITKSICDDGVKCEMPVRIPTKFLPEVKWSCKDRYVMATTEMSVKRGDVYLGVSTGSDSFQGGLRDDPVLTITTLDTMSDVSGYAMTCGHDGMVRDDFGRIRREDVKKWSASDQNVRTNLVKSRTPKRE